MPVLNDNPLLAFLGRRGRGAVVEALRRNPNRGVSIRELARLADVAPMAASRAVAELERLGAVLVVRKNRAVTVRLDAASRSGVFLAQLEAPAPPF